MKMSYYSFNRERLLKNAWDKITIKEENKKLLSTIVEMQKKISIETCQKRKRIKKGNIKEKDTMNIKGISKELLCFKKYFTV